MPARGGNYGLDRTRDAALGSDVRGLRSAGLRASGAMAPDAAARTMIVVADSLEMGAALVGQAIPALAALLRAHRQAQEASDGMGRVGDRGRGGLDGAGHEGREAA